MKILSIALTSLVLAAQAHALVVPLSESRSVSVSGTASGLEGGKSFSDSQSSAGVFGNFNGSASGSADWVDSILPPPGPLGNPPNHAESQATQNSSITENQISVSGNLTAASRNNGSYQGTGASSTFTSIFEVSFEVTSSVEAFVSLSLLLFGHDWPRPQVDFALTSLNYGNSVNLNQIWDTTFNTILEPDIYYLRFNVSGSSLTDPLGDFKWVDYNLNLDFAELAASPQPTSVPDTGTSVGLLGVALVGLEVLRRHWRQATV